MIMVKLRFLHIPKTAGSTFKNILKRQYRGRRHFDFSGEFPFDIKRFQALSAAEKQQIELFTGHAPIITGLPEADHATIITVLRDPVSRVKSFCQHVAEGKSPYLLSSFPPASFRLDEFLQSGIKELSNLQTKMLINQGSCASSVLIDSMSAATARDMALENLTKRVAYFGIQEHFNESLILFASKLHWRIPVYISMNKKDSQNLLEFTEDHLEQIVALNAIDIEVYKAAKASFHNIFEAEKFSREKLLLFRLIQRVTSPCLQSWIQIRKNKTLLRMGMQW
jgi:hypothetical protein